MAQDQQVVTVGNAWTQLTNGDVSKVLFQALQGSVYIAYTVGTTAPTAAQGILYEAPNGEQRSLVDLVNLVGANRVWAKSATGATSNVLIDHA